MRPRSGRSRRFLRSGGLVLVPFLAAVACSGDTSQAGNGPPTVVTSIYPLTWVAERVAGDTAQVTNLADSSADPHHLELTPRQIVEAKEANLVVYIEGLQPAMDDAVARHAQGHSLDVASATRGGRTPGHGPDGADGQGEGPGDRQRGRAFDPHIWLDPVRFAAVAQRVGDRLAAADPAHAQEYRQRARQTAGQLHELDHAYATALRECDTRTLVTSHRAFGHLTQRYDLRQLSIAGLDPEVEPAPARLAEVARVAAERDVRTIFHDQSASAEFARVVADEVGARTAALDTVTDPPEGDSSGYLAVMRANLGTLREALGCS